MIDQCISNIIQSRINYVKVMSKYVGKRVFFFYPPSIKTNTSVVLQRKEMTSLIGSLLNMRAPKLFIAMRSLEQTNKAWPTKNRDHMCQQGGKRNIAEMT